MFDNRNVLARSTSTVDYGRLRKRRAHHIYPTGRRQAKGG
jgi:hypothetical protein